MTNDEEWDEDFFGIDRISEKIDALNEHIDHLLSWEEFASKCLSEVQKLSRRLSSIELIAESCIGNNEEVDYVFGLGTCWIGAVAAYEGFLHKLFLNALSVKSLQSQIATFCKSRIDKKIPLKRGMKDASPKSVREWLTTRTITDPRTMTENFKEIFGIKITPPDDAFCDYLLNVRNAFAHRGGENHSLSIPKIKSITESLNHLATSFSKSLVSEVKRVLQENL